MIKGHTQNMSRFVIAIATVAALCVCAPAEASIVVTVDKSAQRLSVAIDGSPRYQWPVSTARWGYSTPNGDLSPRAAGAQMVFSQIRLVADAVFYFLRWWVRHSWQLRDRSSRPSGIARLHPAASTKRCHPICAGQRAHARDEYRRYRARANALRRKMAMAILTTDIQGSYQTITGHG